jgi:hypothetical protein
MRRTDQIASMVKEELVTVWNRSGQLVHDLTELGLELASLDRLAADLLERARTFVEPPPRRDGYYVVDPAVDTSDTRETILVLKERLRRTAENLEHARRLLEERCETIRTIVG